MEDVGPVHNDFHWRTHLGMYVHGNRWLKTMTADARAPQARGGYRSKHPHMLALKVFAHVGEYIHRHLLMANAMGVARNSGNHVIRTEFSHTVCFQFETKVP